MGQQDTISRRADGSPGSGNQGGEKPGRRAYGRDPRRHGRRRTEAAADPVGRAAPRPGTARGASDSSGATGKAGSARRSGTTLVLGACAIVAIFLFAQVLVRTVPTENAPASSKAEATPAPLGDEPPEGMPAAAEGRAYDERPVPVDPSGYTVPLTKAGPPGVVAERAVVLDGRTGAVLWGRSEREQAPMASTIKILTGLVALRWTDDEPVAVTEDALVGERSIYLETGETVPADQMLAATLVGSANDAATALALHIGGDMEGYLSIANWLAQELGAWDTAVRNPHGLDQDGHVSTAYDLAVLARAGLEDPAFAGLVSQTGYAVDRPDLGRQSTVRNKNRLLEEYEGADGVKTGGTKLAGNSLVGSAERGDERFVVVSMSSEDPTADDVAMLDWAFANYETVVVAEAGEEVDADVGTVVPESDLVVTVPSESVDEVSIVVEDGKLMAMLDGEPVASADVR